MTQQAQSYAYKHFQGKEALEHVAEARAKGVATTTESHGTEAPGHISAAADAMRETAAVMLTLWTVLVSVGVTETRVLLILTVFGLAWIGWKIGRSAWLGWSRLERLHRVIQEEKWEIEHHRQQEREELKALYAAKGFSGQLLEEVLDVLMADGDRLLKVMLEEELGLTLHAYEHPLRQAIGAGISTALTLIFCIGMYLYSPLYGMIGSGLAVLALGAAFSAWYEKNQIIKAVIWNIGLGVLVLGIAHFTIKFLLTS